MGALRRIRSCALAILWSNCGDSLIPGLPGRAEALRKNDRSPWVSSGMVAKADRKRCCPGVPGAGRVKQDVAGPDREFPSGPVAISGREVGSALTFSRGAGRPMAVREAGLKKTQEYRVKCVHEERDVVYQ